MNEDIKEILDRIKKHYVLDEEQDIILLNYIINLQEENIKLKETNEEHRKINGELRKENQKLVKVIDELEKELRSSDENDEYKGILDILTELKGGSDE